MVTRNTSYLIIVVLSDEVCLDRYIFSMVGNNRYLLRSGKENVLSTAITADVTMTRQVMVVVTTLFLDFVMIH